MKTFLLSFLVRSASAQIVDVQAYDVVVYGGTPGGVVAAVAAARSGAQSALLIEQNRHVGGLSTNGINTAELEPRLRLKGNSVRRSFENCPACAFCVLTAARIC